MSGSWRTGKGYKRKCGLEKLTDDMNMKYRIGYTTGVYDMFHIGHLNILRRAKEMCDFLIVGVTTDELCYIRKKKYPIINQTERMEIVGAIRYVDKVVFQETMDKLAAVQKYNVNVMFVGSDWKGTDSWNEYEKQLSDIGCDVVYFDYTDGVSSSKLRSVYENRM